MLRGTHGNPVIDISSVPSKLGYFTYDPGFVATASCQSDITYLDGEQGELSYRGYPIEQIAKHTSFSEAALLLINGGAPSLAAKLRFSKLLTRHALLHEGMRHHFEDSLLMPLQWPSCRL